MTSPVSAATIAYNGSSGSTPTALTVLAQVSIAAAQTATTVELANINKLIQHRLTDQIAALEPSSDAAVGNALSAQISSLQTEQTSTQKLEAQWGANANIFPGLQGLLSQLQTYAAAGNSAAFDSTLAAANVDVSDLKLIAAPSPYQPDQVGNLKENGLGIASSSTYDLSTPSGQLAAAAAVSSAQSFIGQIFAVTQANQLVAGDIVSSLSTQISSLTSLQQQAESSSTAETQKRITALSQNAQNQEHLIELSLGTTSEIANMVSSVANPPQPITSVFQALQASVGATPSSYSSTKSAPAILSLLT